MVEWLLAKYMPDLRRREPRNVGVVVFADARAVMRFRGMRPDGSVDGRAAPVAAVEVYKGWIEYWQYLAGVTTDPDEWCRHRSFENYWMERGGELLAGDIDEPGVLLEHLYRELVEDVADVEWRLADRVEAILQQAELTYDVSFRRPYRVIAEDTGETYSYPYGYENGHRVIAERIAQIGPRNARSRLWEFFHLPADIRKIVFTEHASDDKSVELLAREADVLEVAEISPAQVRELFLSPSAVRRRML